MNYSALIGNPTDHSVSYLLYVELAKAAGLPGYYQHIRVNVAADTLKQSLKAFNTLHFVGLNITLPYKLDVIQHVDELDSIVNELGAVNTIKLGDKTKGYNTDWAGIAESVRQFGGHKQYHSAVIFGTGGAARAAIYACKQLGVKNIDVLYRTETSENTRRLQDRSNELGIKLHQYTHVKELLSSAQLVMNATSAGMVGKEALPFDLATIEGLAVNGKVFLDAVFNPLRTPLLEYFEKAGATVIDGLWMMIYQGVQSLAIWFDQDIEVGPGELRRIHQLLEEELKKNV